VLRVWCVTGSGQGVRAALSLCSFSLMPAPMPGCAAVTAGYLAWAEPCMLIRAGSLFHMEHMLLSHLQPACMPGQLLAGCTHDPAHMLQGGPPSATSPTLLSACHSMALR
jgi:hypothetical protein